MNAYIYTYKWIFNLKIAIWTEKDETKGSDYEIYRNENLKLNDNKEKQYEKIYTNIN